MRSRVVGAVLVAAAAVSVAVAPSMAAVESQPAREQVSLLYSLTGDSGSMRLLPGSGNRYAFTLKGADERTVWFSNRPARHAGTLPTAGFVDQWADFGFAADPPNVAITVHEPNGATDTIVAVMRNPSINRTGTLRATMEVLSTERAQALTGNLARHGDAHDAMIPGSLGSVSVFIDDVTGTVINGCLIQPYTQCPGGNLSGADLAGQDLSGADLAGANLTGARLAVAGLFSADLSGAWLERADLSGAWLERADLSGANLKGATLADADVSYADLSGADLSGADLSGATLSGANLSGADLIGAQWTYGPTCGPSSIGTCRP